MQSKKIKENVFGTSCVQNNVSFMLCGGQIENWIYIANIKCGVSWSLP